MLELPTIWANRLSVIAANLRFDEREHREVAATAHHVRWDYHGRFLIELVQNAADQATRAGMDESEILIVRTPELLAVLNQGFPLDDEGLRALTSLSYDTKDPALTIGNKGLGFKAVFQVSDSPEVFSAPLAGGGLLAPGGYRFAFSPRPLEHSALLSELARVAAQFEREDPAAARRVCEQQGRTSFDDVLLEEAGHGAPFRFPLPRDESALRERITELGLSSEDILCAGALVILPLKGGSDVQQWVDDAVDGLVSDDGGASLLFLTGVGKLRCEDRRRGVTHVLERREEPALSVDQGGTGRGRASIRVTRRSRATDNGDTEVSTRRWWVCSRTLGRTSDSDTQTAAEESRRILQAVAAFPGEHWARVDHATVDVALPVPPDGTSRGQPLGTGGLFCIGLPTHMGTGTPVWVNARFHGNIARKEIDLTQNAYNQILFEEAVELVRDLVSALKSADDLASRRLATLALESAQDSVLGRVLRQPGGLLDEDVVLAADGVTFMAGHAVALPRENDVAMYRLLAEAGADGGGFVLPDERLMRNARSVLRQLGASEGPVSGPDRRYLDRDEGGLSLAERGARHHRNSGPSFWEPFLSWVLDRYTGALLADQRILPTGTDALSTAAEKVYAAPLLPESILAAYEPDDPQRLDRVIATRLRLFEERCVAIRESDGVRYTRIGTRLRQAEPPLVREPVLADLVREVFGPRLQELTAAAGNEREAIALLRIVAEWAQARDVKDLPLGSLRAPCEGTESQEWAWSVPTRVYLGRGWQDVETDALLARAYGETAGRLLVSWPQFAAAAEANEGDRDWWIRALQRLGVWAYPRVLLHTHTNAPMQATSYAGPLLRSYGSRCPAGLTAVQEHWNAYLEAIRHRRAAVTSNQPYDVEKLRWIDGLESDRTRVDVVALMLGRPEVYERFLTTKLSRLHGHGDATEVPSLWVHALRHAGWRTIPTTHGLAAPDEAWLLVGDQRRHRRERYRFLPCVVEAAEPAQRLLLAMGVSTLDDAPPERYVRALQAIAARLEELRPDDMADAIVLAEELYRELQGRLATAAADLPVLLERPLPMFDGIDRRRLCGVDLREPPVILVDDNPVRARFVEGAQMSAVLPVSSRRGHAALVAAIEAQAGAGSVRYTSTAPVDVRFASSGGVETTVATYLERSYPGHALRRDLALLLSAVATSAAGPSGDRIRRALERYDTVRLRFGTFDGDAGVTSFLHEQDEHGVSLLVDQTLRSSPDQVFAATWELVGAHRDLWGSYATALRDGTTERFLAERGVTAAETREVELLLDPARAARFDAVKPIILAVGIASGAIADERCFAEEWASHTGSADSLAGWVGRPDLADAIALAASTEDHERATLQILDAAGLSARDWQNARELLGLPRHRFLVSRQAYERARGTGVAALMATAAHAVSVDLTEARTFLEAVEVLQPAPALLDEPRPEAKMLSQVLTAAREILAQSAATSLSVLLSRVDEGLASEEARVEAALQMRVPQREVDEYRLPETTRTPSAERDVSIVLDAARRLAEHLGESLDVTAIATDGRVATLRSGWWANRFAVLDALRQALQDAAPITTRRLSEERAFRDPGPPGALIGRIQELADTAPQPAPAPAPPPRLVAVAGVSLSRTELDPDLARGSDGQIGAELRRHAAPQVDFESARRAEPPPSRSRGRHGGWSAGRRGSYSAAQQQDDRELNGLLGEAFVYELFREQLPGFDYQCWRSMNAVRYGVATEGDDSLGADFIYRDSRGVLTGRSDAPEVYLEVKATSEEGATPFDVSAGEWETALRIHHEGAARAYAIVRIERVRSTPVLHRIFLDPVRLSREGLLVVEAADLRVYGA